jgi:two-component SAPR family response regulator
MKKFSMILAMFILLSVNQAFADDFFDNYAGIDHAWDNQKPVTNDEFEKAIDTLTAKQKKKEEKARKKKIKKISGGGTSLHKGLEPTSEIIEQETIKNKGEKEGQLLNIPVDVVVDGKVVEKGFYNVFGEKDEKNDIYLLLYQAHNLLGKIKVYPTNNDFGSDDVDFVKITPYDNNYMKIMFGSLDFNAYGYLKYIPEKSSFD